MNHQETLTAYTAAFIDELSSMNVKHAVISPGSRSTPISMLLLKHPTIETHINIDERSAAFFALGIAKSTREPVVIVCTSGTAAANYYPAIVEAQISRVPLIVVTADRPHELRDVGAPQAINQIQLYGQYVKWFSEMAIPEMTDSAIQYVRNTARRAAIVAKQNPAGPVHLNFPVREPLIPNMNEDYFHIGRRATSMHMDSFAVLEDSSIDALVKELTKKKKGIIVCGEIHDTHFADAVIELAEKLGFPILADPLSQLRTSKNQSHVIDCYDTFLRIDEAVSELHPDVIIRFGAMPVSKALTLFMKQSKEVTHIVVDGGTGWREPTGMATQMISCDETLFCRRVAEKLSPQQNHRWFELWEQLNQLTRTGLQSIQEETSMNEGKIFAELRKLLPDEANVFVSNSMPIRDCDTFFHCNETNSKVYANRGANGIDGVVSTALGVSVEGKPTVLVIGDLSFYHDMNGLLAAKMLNLNITIIVVNNDGGGIFSFLPQSSEKEYFEELFGTPHGLDFSHAVQMYGGEYTKVESWKQFEEAFVESFQKDGLKVLEVRTDREENVIKHRNLWKDVSKDIVRFLSGDQDEYTM
ncbi:2-succinyl-5-enolpyruvyl-6-hydroxy-3-cyclohexene-1-carboxylic-acid synthase [Bacillus massiliigorillae]|uniref:2-succinyl-5-enolpyruvyl-6-hydroxy-3- cyclohexene-1-carboxylic-acid synthase n=1 Tax=Bacillus massiliigorillae TaxID=1243664 RepID=UPI0003A28F9F|nr:2-succinyl-5-enolpyruvyl-6-hydroxy-3-cyclohexene-1-carboxylic-acid synthase [Bacillus massiliigorillae]